MSVGGLGRLTWRASVLAAIAVWLAVTAALWPAHAKLLNWDEVDYVNAGRLGAWTNAIEHGSLSPFEFLAFANSKRLRTEPELPPDYVEERDPLVLRHWHSPFVVYLLSVVVDPARPSDEHLVRSVPLLGALVLIAALLVGYRALSGGGTAIGTAVVLALAFWMSMVLFQSVSFHGWAAVWTVTTAHFAARWLEGRTLARATALCASLALGLLTLETGLFVWAGAVLCLVLWRGAERLWGRRGFLVRYVLPGGLLAALLTVAAWPGVLLKVSLLKSVATHAYRVSLGEEYAGFVERFPDIFLGFLPLVATSTVAVMWLLHASRDDMRRWGPFAVVAGTYGLVMVPVALSGSHVLAALAPLACLVGLAADRLEERLSRPLLGLATALLIVITIPLWYPNSSDPEREDLDWLRERLRDRESLVDGGHIVAYYLGDAYRIQPVIPDYGADALLIRRAGEYVTVSAADVAGKVIVLEAKRPEKASVERDLLGRCARADRPTVRLYDCSK